MKREKLIEKLKKLLEKQKSEIKPHRLDGIVPPYYDCWVLYTAIRDLESPFYEIAKKELIKDEM